MAKALWRGKHKALELRELNHIQPKFGKIKRKSSFRQLCLFSVYFIDLCEEEEVTPLSKKRKPEGRISTRGSVDESDDNEFVESKKEAQISSNKRYIN